MPGMCAGGLSQAEQCMLPVQAAVKQVAALIGAQPADVVPVANATSAVNVVVSSLSLKRGDLLLMTSLTYPAVRP